MDYRSYVYNNSTVTLLFGDILQTKADVIVSSDDSDMSMGGGVSRHIAEAAGETIWRILAKYPPVLLGDVAVTDAGELPQKYIFHCITIDYHDLEWEGKFSSREEYHNFIIQHAVDKCFRLMQSMNLTSIAFPLIGTGAAHIPLLSAATQMAECFAKNLQKTSKSLNIELYLFDRFNRLSDIDYLPVFEQFAIMSAWGRFMKGELPVGDETTAESSAITKCKHDVFISYSRSDTVQATDIRKILDDNHVTYWIDKEGMYSQESFKTVLVEAIKAARVVIFLSSKDSNASTYVQKEISTAVKYNKPVIPIMLDDAPFASSIEFDLQDIDHLDYHEDFQKKLLMNIRMCISQKQANA